MPDSKILDCKTRFVGRETSEILTKIHIECFPRYWNRQAFTDFFSVENTFAILVENYDQPVAMIVYRIVFEQADILTIAVLPAFRKKGIAKKLIGDALEHCKKLGAKKLFIDVEVGNEAALKLYENTGFKQISRRKLYYQQLDGSLTDSLVMSKKL